MVVASPELTALESLQAGLIECVQDCDRQGLHLLLELAQVRFGKQATTQLVCELPSLVDSELVPIAFRLVHGDEWTVVAREVCIQAAAGMAQLGIEPGIDISLGIEDSGAPVFFMARKVFQALDEIAPHSLHLLRAFLVIE